MGRGRRGDVFSEGLGAFGSFEQGMEEFTKLGGVMDST